MNPFIPPQPAPVVAPTQPVMDVVAGSKSYIAAIGLLGLGIYQLTEKDYILAIQSFMAALAAFGIRNAIGRQEFQLFQMKQFQMQQFQINKEINK